MRIIQSFAKFKKGSPHTKTNKEFHLNFYSFLLSYLILNKYYGHVTMFCNEEAYNNLIKYIPYDDIIIMENENDLIFWSYYKINAMEKMTEDFIHVDSDIFIFEDLFRPFIEGNYDAIVQNWWSPEGNEHMIDFVKDNTEFILKNNIINPKIYDDGSICGGVIGMKINLRDGYVQTTNKIKLGYEKNLLNVMDWRMSMISEELSMHLYTLANNLKVFYVLSPSDVEEHGIMKVGDKRNFTHLWGKCKFDEHHIDLIRRKIRNEFPYYRSLIDKFEMENIYK